MVRSSQRVVEVQRVCVAQERCREQGDQDVVEKIVAQVFEKMPADLVKMDHHKAMRANGPCRVRCVMKPTGGSCSCWGSAWVMP